MGGAGRLAAEPTSRSRGVGAAATAGNEERGDEQAGESACGSARGHAAACYWAEGRARPLEGECPAKDGRRRRLGGASGADYGGSSGIGLAIARALGEEGYALTVSARRPDKLEAAAEGLAPTDSRCRALPPT